MAKRGRPSLLTPETKRKLLEAIRAGSHYEPACRYAGIHYSTFRNWMVRAEGGAEVKPTQEYLDFLEAVQEAESHGEIQSIASIKAASKEDWRAAGWMLERRHPERWANTQKVKLLVDQQVASEINMLFEVLLADPDLSTEVKRKILETASDLRSRKDLAEQN